MTSPQPPARRHPGGSRILVATTDALTGRMAGPAIRAWHVADALAAEHEVVLASTSACGISSGRFRICRVDDAGLRDLERWCDVVVFQGFLMQQHPFLRTSRKVLVVDVYDPVHLEQLEQTRGEGAATRRAVVASGVATLNEQLARGDFFLCASEKQRDFWLGQLAGLGRLNPATYDEDETLSSLIAVAPFGVPEDPPVRTRPALKGVVPGIGPDDKVILWGGGIYNWFDPLTLLRAVERLQRRRPEVRLFFMGLKHPNPVVPEMEMARAARRLSAELGLTGRVVFFNEGWVPYDDRQNYLLEADVGVSTHLDHVEAAFSFRTRVLDYLWASLPVVATRGDALAGLVEVEGVGLTVPPGAVGPLAEALERVLDDDVAAACRRSSAALARRFGWSQALRPLLEFCRTPRRAPDLLEREAAEGPGALAPAAAGSAWRRDLALGLAYLRDGGPGLMARKATSRLRRLLG